MAFSLNNLFFRLNNKQKMLFARNLEVMTRSGMQVLDGLEILKKQSNSRAFGRMIDLLIADVKNGHYLSAGLEKYSNVFGEFFINLIRVGETSGTLSENLKYLADELKKKDELNKKIKGAMIYPIIILIATTAIGGALIFFIFPKIIPVLNSIKVPLPAITLLFIAISGFLIKFGLYVLGGLIALIIGFLFLLRVKAFRYKIHELILITPIISNMSKTINMITLARTLGLLLKSGVKIIEALQISANTLSNMVYQKEVNQISEGVRRGESLSKYLNSNPHLFPPIFSEMISVGENTGKLDESLLFLSNYYEAELDESTKTMSNILEPMLLLIMGVIVGAIALAIITPIYRITQTLGR
jgi:type IV pilus assembly protein PilC